MSSLWRRDTLNLAHGGLVWYVSTSRKWNTSALHFNSGCLGGTLMRGNPSDEQIQIMNFIIYFVWEEKGPKMKVFMDSLAVADG